MLVLDCSNILMRPSLVLLLGLLAPDPSEAMTVVRAGGREDEAGRLRSH